MGILQDLHDSEINATISAFYDGIWNVSIGDALNGIKAKAVVRSEAEAEAWLHMTARELFPDSEYARRTNPN